MVRRQSLVCLVALTYVYGASLPCLPVVGRRSRAVVGRPLFRGEQRPARRALGPCSFRKVVLAALRGNGEPLMHIERAQFVGGLREIGGGIYQRLGPRGSERRLATFLTPATVEVLLRDCATTTTTLPRRCITITSSVSPWSPTMTRAPSDLRLDAVAHRVAATCLVEELIAFADRDATA